MATTLPERRAASPGGMGVRNQRLLQRVLIYALLITIALIVLLPLIWMLSTSFKPKSQWFAREVEWIPRTFTWDNYARIFGNRTTPIGARVMFTSLKEDGTADKTEVFADGWLTENGEYLGRPVDVAQLPDGSILVSDDLAGAIYRISYEAR